MDVPSDVDGNTTFAPYLTYAWQYRKAGWPGVLPLPFAKKAEPPEGYTGRFGKIPTDDQIDQWCHDHADGNICLRLPDDVVGLDVDDYDNKPGARSIQEAERKLGPLPETPRSSARPWPSGIRLYRVPAGSHFMPSLDRVLEHPNSGVDIIQHGHRYAVTYPSVHPDVTSDTGTLSLYRWYNGTELKDVPRVDELPALPDTWLQALATPFINATQITSEAVAAFYNSLVEPSGALCARMRMAAYRYRNDFVSQRYFGSRHDAAMQAVHDLQHLGAQGHHGVMTGLEVVHQAYLLAKTTFEPTRPQQASDAEWERLVCGQTGVGIVLNKLSKGELETPDSGDCDCAALAQREISPMQSFMGEPGVMVDSPVVEQPSFNENNTEGMTREQWLRAQPDYKHQLYKTEIAEQVRRDLKKEQFGGDITEADTEFIIGTDFESEEIPAVKYRVNKLWVKDGNVLLAAQYKSGKTTLVGNLLRCLVDEDDFLEQFQTIPLEGRVALLDTEMPKALLQEWTKDQGIRNTDRYMVKGIKGQLSKFNILDTECRQLWVKKFRSLGVKILILDNLAPLLSTFDLKESTEAGKFLTALDALKLEAQIDELVLVHHMGHTGERARGDSRLRDWPDVEWRLVRECDDDGRSEPNADCYFTAFGRDVDVLEGKLDFDRVTRHLTLTGGTRKENGSQRVSRAIIEYLTDHERSNGSDIERGLMANGHPRGPIRNALSRLVQQRQVVTDYGPRNSTLYRYAGTEDFFYDSRDTT